MTAHFKYGRRSAFTGGVIQRKELSFGDDPSNAEISAGIETLAKLFAEFQQKNDRELAEIKKSGTADVVTREEVARLNEALTQINNEVKGLQAAAARHKLGGTAADTDEAKTEYRKAFYNWMRKGKGEDGLRGLEMKSMTAGTEAEGGFLVPEVMETAIDSILALVSAMRGLSTVMPIGSAFYTKLVNQRGTASGWVGETDARPETAASKLVEMTFNAMEIYANPAATQALLDDAAIDLAAWMANEVNIEFAEQEGTAFITGNGVGKPKGILSYPMVANSAYAWGKVGYVVSGADGAFKATGSDPADCLLDLKHALRPGYRNGATWIMNDTTQAAVRKLKDSYGQYLWQPGLQAEMPDMLLGKPVAYDDNMPDIASDSYAIAFGNFKRGYLIVDRIGVRVLRDPFTNKPYINFYTTKRVGGGIQNFEAIKALKFATA